MSLRNLDKKTKRLTEKRGDTRHRTKREFISSLEIVKDHAKVKNYRRRQGAYFDVDAAKRYERNYERIFGKQENREHSPTGFWVWEPRKGKLVPGEGKMPSGKLVTL